MTILQIICAYFALGIIALVLLDWLTGRVRSRLRSASYDAQSKLVLSGNYVGTKMALVLTVVVLWLFWPLAIFSAISSQLKKG